MPLRELTNDLVQRWYDAGVWQHKTIYQVVDDHASVRPDHPAVADQHESLTYRELSTRSAGLARWLVDQGLEPGQTVALQSPNRVALAITHLACDRADLVFLPLSNAWRHTELKHLLGTSQAALAIVPGPGKDVDHLALVDELRGDLPALRTVGALDGAGGDFDFDVVSQPADELEVRPRDPNDPRFIMVTSGTTELPRMAQWTDNNLWAFMQAYIAASELAPGDRSLGLAPANTGATGYVFPVLAPMLVGSSSILQEAWDPSSALDLLVSTRATAATAIPTQLIKLLQEPDVADRDYASLACITNAGAAMPAEKAAEVEQVFGCDIQAVYGATDGGVPVMTRRADAREKRYHTVGRPLPHGELRLAGADLEPVAPGEAGEICWRSPTKHLGYLNEPDRTEAAFEGDGWYRSGDLGEIDDEGYLTIVGRAKDLIIRGGQNISPKELEELLIGHPAVAEVSVIGVPDPTYGERTCACVEVRAEASLSLSDVTEFLQSKQVAKFKLPEHLEVFDELPKSAGGKISKVELRDHVVQRIAASA